MSYLKCHNFAEKDLNELLEKKFEILEDLAFNQKELQEVQVLAAVHPDSTSGK